MVTLLGFTSHPKCPAQPLIGVGKSLTHISPRKGVFVWYHRSMKMLIKVTEEERDGEMWAIMTELFCGSQAECDAFIKRGGAGDTKAIVVAEVNSEEERANILKPMKVSEMKSPNKVDTSNVSWTLRLGQMREYISSTSNVRLAWFLPANPRPMLKIPMSLLV